MEEIPISDSLIVASKLIHVGMLHGLANGGEMPIENRWGIRCVHRNNFLEFSIIIYGKEPKFKYQKFFKPKSQSIPSLTKKPSVPQEDNSELVIKDGGNIFSNL